MKWIVGYVDAYGCVHARVIGWDESIDSHRQIWPTVHHNKWRWIPDNPTHLNTYGEDLDEDAIDRIWRIIDTYC